MQLDFYQARSEADYQDAFALVSEEYKKDGYIDVDVRPDIPVYNSLPTSATFIARSPGGVLGTVTVVGDGTKGLPMENIYREEIGRLREVRKKIVEISQLAVRRSVINQNKEEKKRQNSIALTLFRNRKQASFPHIPEEPDAFFHADLL